MLTEQFILYEFTQPNVWMRNFYVVCSFEMRAWDKLVKMYHVMM